ncbi:uncharacterized protein LACBIDRAFT_291562 [Laccaria bicolor S238N-H82]|uniref:Predicted protein n=1 Tax=Laccaria bicolor (strain S238N-H82 / ATCC MYA-4686) TaxID=486041 RepID=B0CQP0_LACBS|nr:uncharacterized protein LACBIDRAFT_291562 [Laccaria bicolor S238N-H82]EDR15064.1 predicted protein [Laccaria bicolor S238N-H82]|eukprot:XP_001873272.1 predicted protein [Laccaria bicolor S238N-H82]
MHLIFNINHVRRIASPQCPPSSQSRAVTHPSHRNSSVTKKIDPTSETKRGTSNNDPLQGLGVSSTPRNVAPDPSSTSSLAQPIYRPSGAWAWLDGLSLRDFSLYICDCEKTILRLLKMVATSKLTSEQVELLAGRSGIYPSHGHSTRDAMVSYQRHVKLALYKKQLKPLQGIVVPNIIGVFTGTRRINVAMEVPHSSFWIESSSDMPNVLKKACVEALEKLHAQGVFHGNIGLSHFLIGGDARVTIVGFHAARALDPNPQVYLGSTTAADLRLELRKLKFKLDYQGAREKEREKFTQYVKRAQRNRKERFKVTRDPTYSPNYEDDPQSDRLDPPVDVRQPIGWLDALEEAPRRYIMPGQSIEDYENAVHDFLSVLYQMDTGHLPPTHIPSPSPPSSPGEGSGMVVPISAVPYHVSSKRKRVGGPEVASPSSKRPRTSVNSPSRAAGLQLPSVSDVPCTNGPLTDGKAPLVLDCSVASDNASTNLPQIRVRDFAYESFQPLKLDHRSQASTSKGNKPSAKYPNPLRKLNHPMASKAPSTGVTDDYSIAEACSIPSGTETIDDRTAGKRRRDEVDQDVPEFSGHSKPKRMRLLIAETPAVNSSLTILTSSEVVAPPSIPLSIPQATTLPTGNSGVEPGSSATFSDSGHSTLLQEPSGLNETPLVYRLITWWRDGLLRLIQ